MSAKKQTEMSVVENMATRIPQDADQVVTLSLMPNGDIDIQSSIPNYGFVHQMLNRSVIELVFHEKNMHLQNQQPVLREVEAVEEELTNED